MRRYIFLLCAFVTLTANAQRVSEIEAFKKAQKFLNDKKLKAPRATTRGEEVYNPYYIFNAEDGKGCVIVSGDERLPEVLVYSKEQTIDENNIPSELKELIPILDCDGRGTTRGGSYKEIPSEYVPRNTTVIEPIMPAANRWGQREPFNRYCPEIFEGETELERRAWSGCGPTAISQVMNYFKYPKSVDAFDTTISVWKPSEPSGSSIDVSVPYTEFKWDFVKDYYGYGYTDEEANAVAELLYHVGCAFKVAYAHYGTATNATQGWVKWDDVMRNIYKYEEVKFIIGECIEHWDESGTSYTREYLELPDEEYWEFLDSYLERGIPVVAGGGRHIFIIDGRDNNGMYYYYPYYVILQPSLWRQIGEYGALIKNNEWLHLLAFVPPKEYIPQPKRTTAIVSTKVEASNDGVVYNLQGHKVGNTLEGLPKGVYIKDGKKQVVK